jgi:hypothetical protein
MVRVLPRLAALAGLLLLGCSTDSPTEPQRVTVPPGGGVPQVSFVITVTATPNSLEAGGDQGTLLTITVRRADNGAAPVNGTTIVVSTTLGAFGTVDSGLQQVVASLLGGVAQIQLFPGDVPGTAAIRAQLQNDFGGVNVAITGQSVFFIQGVVPNIGSARGGNQVAINGGGFKQPLRVLFGGVPAPLIDVTSTRIVVSTPPRDIPLGTTESVAVTVENDLGGPDAATETLANAFTYTSNALPNFFVQGVQPNTGSADGGQQVTVLGGGFISPVRVLFGGVPATLVSVAADQIRVITPPATVPVGSTLSVAVTVENDVNGANAATDTLQNGFTYVRNPASTFFVEAVAPDTGAASGGEQVTIIGGGFVAPVRVFFGANPATVLGVTSARITVQTPAIVLGPGQSQRVDVRVDNDINGSNAESDTLPNAFTYLSDTGAFFIQEIQPNEGDSAGDESVDVVGGGFLAPVRVFFGANPATVTAVTPTRITVRTPPLDIPRGTSQTVNVTVENDINGANAATETLNNAFTYRGGGIIPVPMILSVTPGAGPNEGGTLVTIVGDGFQTPVQVLFGQGTTAADFTGIEAEVVSVTPTQIRVRSPAATGFGQANLNQEVDILVRNVGVGTAGIAPNAFTYGVAVLITSLSPGTGPYFGDTLVTLFGQGFDEPVAVGLAGFAQTPISVTGTEVIMRTVAIDPASCADVVGPSTIVNIETGDGDDGGPDFRYEVDAFTPRIQGLSPESGPQAGGTIVTITGLNLITPLEVVFGDANGTIQSVNTAAGTLTVRTPSFPRDSLLEEACDANGDGTEGTRFIPTAVDVVITNQLTDCTSTFRRGFTYIPADSSCRNDVGEPPPPPPAPVASFTFALLTATNVQFTDTSSGNPVAWQWDFTNDGIIDSIVQFPQHDYLVPGNYPVRLTVTGAGGSDTTLQVVAVPP